MKKSTFFFAAIALLSSCKPANTAKKTISTSIQPIRYFVEQLAGADVAVTSLLSPGDNPHTYEPTPVQMAALSNSTLFFANGQLLFEEEFRNMLKSSNPTAKLIDCSNGIELLEGTCNDHDLHGDHGHANDPHYWVSPANAKKMVQTISAALIENGVAPADSVSARAQRLNSKLAALDSAYKIMVSNAKRYTFIVYHPTLDYIARAYGLTQLAIENNGKDPVMNELSKLISEAKAQGVKYVIVQKQFDQTNAKVISQETGGGVLYINPLGYDYFEESNTIVHQLNKVLND